MIAKLFRSVFGSRNDRVLKRLQKTVKQINSLEDDMAKLADADFPAKTAEYQQRFQDGETLEQLLPEAFALVREAGIRALNMRHFDVQLIGAMVLNEGNIAEMRTGEGKTLVATLATYLNALSGKGVHVITVNDYLAKRDAEWMGQLYGFLGLRTGVIVNGLDKEQRKAAYAADITYGTNNEFGFDYLRDNMAFDKDGRVQRGLNFAVVDEVDSILIDEARTPLIISGMVDDRSDLYVSMNKIVPKLIPQEEEDGPGDYSIDEKSKQAFLTEEGNENVERLLQEAGLIEQDRSLYDPTNISVLHHLNAALRAYALYKKDVDYIVKDDMVVIIDEFTGRSMEGRRWGDGLHQAIEAREGVTIQNENQTLATITYQNYFRLYEKLSGMTGTADTEAYEFHEIYSLEVVVIPTHRPMVRKDESDVVFLTGKEKFAAIIEDIIDCQKRRQPVLVGTASIDVSEFLSKELKKQKIKHQVLNAKFHEQEAQIVAEAGIPGAVTIATNMAGRGTDIVLGGNLESQLANIDDEQAAKKLKDGWEATHQEVLDNGGLYIVGTERHESRRIDNQLRGRSGRQGDPGETRFYLSLEDSLMRIFASERVSAIMQKLGMDEGEAIESKLVSRAIENAQRKVEAHNFDIRKHLLEFDDVANDQRKVIYEQRNELMDEEDISENIEAMREDVLESVIAEHIPPQSIDEMWDVSGLEERLEREFDLRLTIQKWLDDDQHLGEAELKEKIIKSFFQASKDKEALVGSELIRKIEKQLMLDILDRHWKEHLMAMDHLRQGINLRGYAQKNPKQEYKKEAFEMFVVMLDNIKHDVVMFLAKLNITQDSDAAINQQRSKQQNMQFSQKENASALEKPKQPTANKPQPIRNMKKVGRNEPCPCGSGKKYKQCHGKLA